MKKTYETPVLMIETVQLDADMAQIQADLNDFLDKLRECKLLDE